MIIERGPRKQGTASVLFIHEAAIPASSLPESLKNWILEKKKEGVKIIPFIDGSKAPLFIVPFSKEEKESSDQRLERIRTLGHAVFRMSIEYKLKSLFVETSEIKESYVFSFLEGLALSNYKFSKYKKPADSNGLLHQIIVEEKSITEKSLQYLKTIITTVFLARDLVNEPVSYLTAAVLSQSAEAMAGSVGISYRNLTPEEIQAHKMGGVLAVNKGSAAPPAFIILEWKPEKPLNKKPLVLVGKGVVYDTGGYSIKPSSGMETMKCDMAGAAVVFGSMYGAALQQLPLHIIGLVPAVENRVNEHAIVPGDVITISDGTTVEVMNTDAEGRLILADALVYAKKYEPMLVMDFATLTGAALRAIGNGGAVYMGTADKDIKKIVEKSGWTTYERVVEFPLWEEYAEQLKSEIADLSNVGGPLAGASTAGKFLQHFTAYPWLHFDIAGPAFLTTASQYRTVGGTGTGVRFMLEFYKRWMEECLEEEKD